MAWNMKQFIHHFQQPQLEALFAAEQKLYAVHFANLWCIFLFISLIILVVTRTLTRHWFSNPELALFSHAIPVSVVAIMWLAIRFMPRTHAYVHQMLCVASLVMIGWLFWFVHLQTERDILTSPTDKHLHLVWAAVSNNTDASVELQQYVIRESSRRLIWASIFYTLLVFDLLQFLGLSCYILLVFVALPVSITVAGYTSSVITNDLTEILVPAAIGSTYVSLFSLYLLRMHRKKFELDYTLCQSLENEARAMQELAQQETRHKEEAQQADSVLNHILKNMLADAAGCIHLYLNSLTGTYPRDLRQAMNCLDRAMKWCQNRQTILCITSGTYTPQLTKINLREFSTSLVNGRKVKTLVPDEMVEVDPTLFSIVLDNALTNALQHSYVDNPEVSLAVHLLPSPTDPSRRQLTILITNNLLPGTPCLTTEHIEGILNGRWVTQPSVGASSRHLGLQHLFLAAEAHGMSVALQHVDDTLVLQVSLEISGSSRLSVTEEAEEVLALDRWPFPDNFRIFCIDDSAVARRLLKSMLMVHMPTATVKVFGQTAEEVDDFMREALTGADMVIMDNYLDFECETHLGKYLLATLIERGFSGFACIRSANASPADEEDYVQHGAHLVLGKDMHPLQTFKQLRQSYARFVQSALTNQCILSPLCSASTPVSLSLGRDPTQFCTFDLPGMVN